MSGCLNIDYITKRAPLSSPPESAPGIWVFDTIDSAKKHVREYAPGSAKILRVLPIGRATKLKRYRPGSCDPETIETFWCYLAATIRHSDSKKALSMHLYGYVIADAIAKLDGTLIYPAVKVMD